METNTQFPEIHNVFIAALPTPSEQEAILKQIRSHQKDLPSHIPIKWTRPEDLHITLGYLRDFKREYLDQLIEAFKVTEHFKQIQAVAIGTHLYGSALTLSLQPHKIFTKIHQALVKALYDVEDGMYQFSTHDKFIPHITIARTMFERKRTAQSQDKRALEHWARQTFKDYTFEVKTVALMYRTNIPNQHYQKLATYPLRASSDSG